MAIKKDPEYFNPRDYVSQPETKNFVPRAVVIGLIAVAVLGLGTCVANFTRLNKSAAEMQPVSRAFIDEALETGLPAATDGIWSEFSEVTEEQLNHIRNAMAFYSDVERIGETSCNAQSIARSNGLSGTFVICSTPLEYAATNGRILLTWRREADDWKVVRFLAQYDDMSAFYRAEARKEIISESVSESLVPDIKIADD